MSINRWMDKADVSCIYTHVYVYDFLVAQSVNNLPILQETLALSLGWEDPLEKEMATHSMLFRHKKEWNLAITMSINMEGIMLGAVSHRTIWHLLYEESKRYNKLVNITKKNQTHRCREQTTSGEKEKERAKGIGN